MINQSWERVSSGDIDSAWVTPRNPKGTWTVQCDTERVGQHSPLPYPEISYFCPPGSGAFEAFFRRRLE